MILPERWESRSPPAFFNPVSPPRNGVFLFTPFLVNTCLHQDCHHFHLPFPFPLPLLMVSLQHPYRRSYVFLLLWVDKTKPIQGLHKSGFSNEVVFSLSVDRKGRLLVSAVWTSFRLVFIYLIPMPRLYGLPTIPSMDWCLSKPTASLNLRCRVRPNASHA